MYLIFRRFGVKYHELFLLTSSARTTRKNTQLHCPPKASNKLFIIQLLILYFEATGISVKLRWQWSHLKAHTWFNHDAKAFRRSQSFLSHTHESGFLAWRICFTSVNQILNNYTLVFVVLCKSLIESCFSLLSHVDSCMPSKREFNLPVFKMDRRSSFPLLFSIILKKSNDACRWAAIQAVAERKPEKKKIVLDTIQTHASQILHRYYIATT